MLLSLRDIRHRFGAITALTGVSLELRAGTVHALLGENGAGKSTLMRIAFGMLRPNAGGIAVDGKNVSFSSPADALANGIGMVHQHFSLVPSLTVAENVALGGSGLFNPEQAAHDVQRVATEAGLQIDPSSYVGELAVSEQQRCEIVKALSRNVRVLILDEPTAVLAPAESTELLRWIRAFANRGNAVVLITHKLRDALSVADDITVLRHGRVTLSATRIAVDEQMLTSAMIGSAMPAGNALRETRSAARGTVAQREQSWTAEGSGIVSTETIAQLDGVSATRGTQRIHNVTLHVAAGVIAGVVAVEGSGQHVLLDVLAGRLQADSGHVQLPAEIGFVPEDRHRDALLLGEDLLANYALRGAGARRGRTPWASMREATTRVLKTFDVRAGGPGAIARTLSGGNQQKFVVGRELAAAPTLLVADNPTRGLDFNATAAVHDALVQSRNKGTAIVLYSSDLDEVLMLADRVYVVREGRVFESPVDRDVVGHMMLTAT